MTCRFLFLILGFFLVILAYSRGENETLVLLDNLAIKETHSMFFRSLKGKNNLSSSMILLLLIFLLPIFYLFYRKRL